MPNGSPCCSECGYVFADSAADALCPACLLAAVLTRGEMEVEDDANDEDRLQCGPYVLLDLLGRGGTGRVYRARRHDAAAADCVALKLLASVELANSDSLRRFRQEAELLRGLNHPHIIKIHDVGEDVDNPWFAMELASGGNLADLLASQPQGLDPTQAVQWLLPIAEAVEFAHRHGVLHRDLKPANILIGANNRPIVSDFGLARLAQSPSGVTLTGIAMGSPAWMPPEQALGSTAFTTAIDVYSLGAILFQLLTGQPPFQGRTAMDTLQKVLHEAPPALSAHPHIPRDIATVCLKCLEKDPARRYRSAAALADDLRRFLANEPVLARSISWAEKSWRWARRSPAKAALLASLLGGGIAFGVILAYGNRLLTNERSIAIAEAARASKSEASMALSVYAADMFLARRAMNDGNLGSAREALQRHLPAAGTDAPDLRGFEWYALDEECKGDAAILLTQGNGPVHCVEFSPDGKTAVTGGQDGVARFYEAATGKLQRTIPASSSRNTLQEFAELASLPIKCPELADALAREKFDSIRTKARATKLGDLKTLAWSPDGKWFVTGSMGSYVRLWSAREGKMQGFIPTQEAHQAAFSLDSAEILLSFPSASSGGWELRRYATTSLHRLETIPMACPNFGYSGRLAIATEKQAVEIRDLAGGNSVRITSPNWVRSLALNNTGDRLAIFGTETGTLWECPSGRFISGLSHRHGSLSDVVFSADGRLLAGGSIGQVIVLFNGRDGTPLRPLRGHNAEVFCARFAPMGRALLTGSNDQSARYWPTADKNIQATNFGMTAKVVQYLPKSDSFLAVDETGATVQHFLRTNQVHTLMENTVGKPLAAREVDNAPPSVLHWHQEKNELAWHGANDGHTTPLADLSHLKVPVVAVSSEAGLVAYGAKHEPIQVVDWITGEVRFTLPKAPLTLSRMMLSRSGKKMLAYEYPSVFALADVGTGKWLWRQKHTGGTLGPYVFSPNEETIATGGTDALITIRSAASGDVVQRLVGHLSEIGSLAFTTDGQTLASSSKDETIRLWHVPTWRPLGPLRVDLLAGNLQFVPSGLFAATLPARGLIIPASVRLK